MRIRLQVPIEPSVEDHDDGSFSVTYIAPTDVGDVQISVRLGQTAIQVLPACCKCTHAPAQSHAHAHARRVDGVV